MIITKKEPYTRAEIEKLREQIESLSMDLLRVALGYQRKSIKMAERFSKEALARISEIQVTNVKPYFAKVLEKIPSVLSNNDANKIAEDALMYSVICKNYARKFLN